MPPEQGSFYRAPTPAAPSLSSGQVGRAGGGPGSFMETSEKGEATERKGRQAALGTIRLGREEAGAGPQDLPRRGPGPQQSLSSLLLSVVLSSKIAPSHFPSRPVCPGADGLGTQCLSTLMQNTAQPPRVLPAALLQACPPPPPPGTSQTMCLSLPSNLPHLFPPWAPLTFLSIPRSADGADLRRAPPVHWVRLGKWHRCNS